MMNTINIDFPIWVGTKLYYIKDSTIKETYVYKIYHELRVSTSDYNNYNKYELKDGNFITEKDLGIKYFIDKKELIQKLVSQL